MSQAVVRHAGLPNAALRADEVTEDLREILRSCAVRVGPGKGYYAAFSNRQIIGWVTGILCAGFALIGVWFQVNAIRRTRSRNA